MGGGGGGRLFEAGRLLTFSAIRMGAYSRWALIRGWALIRINTVTDVTQLKQNMDLKEETGIEAKLLNSVDCLDSRD